MKTTLIAFITIIGFLQIALAGGSISWAEVKARVSATDPELVKVIERNFEVSTSGGGVRLGPWFGERQGERISPYNFAAVERKSGEKRILIIQESDDFEFTGRFRFTWDRPQDDAEAAPQPHE